MTLPVNPRRHPQNSLIRFTGTTPIEGEIVTSLPAKVLWSKATVQDLLKLMKDNQITSINLRPTRRTCRGGKCEQRPGNIMVRGAAAPVDSTPATQEPH